MLLRQIHNANASLSAAPPFSNCAEGYTGPLCGSCAATFYRKQGVCVQCPVHAWLLVGVFVSAMIIGGAVLQFLQKHRQSVKGLSVAIDFFQVVVASHAHKQQTHSRAHTAGLGTVCVVQVQVAAVRAPLRCACANTVNLTRAAALLLEQ